MAPERITDTQRRDAQVRVLEALGEHLSLQMADLAIGQQEAVKQREEFAKRIKGIEETVAETQTAIHEVLDLLATVKSGFKVLGWLGVGAKWIGGIAAAVVSIYTIGYMITHGGQLPHGPPKP